MKCAGCEKEFEPRKGGGSPPRFCSRRCNHKTHNEARRAERNAYFKAYLEANQIKCAHCQTDFTRSKYASNVPRYCCRRCADEAFREARRAERNAYFKAHLEANQIKCARCEKKFTPNKYHRNQQRYCCSRCWAEDFTEYHAEQQNAYYRKQRGDRKSFTLETQLYELQSKLSQDNL